MPEPTPTLTLQSARRSISERSFYGATPSPGADRVGIELEWFSTPSEDPPQVADLQATLASVEPLPCGSRISFEPGAQVELSSAPLPLREAIEAIATDTEVVSRRLMEDGVELFASGLDARRSLQLRT